MFSRTATVLKRGLATSAARPTPSMLLQPALFVGIAIGGFGIATLSSADSGCPMPWVGCKPTKDSKTIVATSLAPDAIGPYSQAVKTGNGTVYVSGNVGFDPATMKIVKGGPAAETEQALKNMGEILKEAGSSYDDVVKTTVLLASIKDFAEVNKVYSKYFSSGLPARACFAVKELPAGALIEIDAVAICPTKCK